MVRAVKTVSEVPYQGNPKEIYFSPTADSFEVSAQIGSGVVRGGPEVRFHEGSTRVPQGFHQVPPGSTRFCEGMLLGISPDLILSGPL